MFTRAAAGWILCATLIQTVHALGPHEVALLINAESAVSRQVGYTYARLRRIPAANIVEVRVPMRGDEPPARIGPEEFRRLIFDPAVEALRERGVAPHILGWAYAPGFPPGVSTEPAMSLTGFTFTRGVAPEAVQIEKGTGVSPYYAGPGPQGGPVYQSRSLDVLGEWQGRARPVPAMMLGYVGRLGSTVDTAIGALARGMDGDGTRPTGTVFFVVHDDIRSRSRSWQYGAAVAELRQMGVGAVVAGRMPDPGMDVAGLMTGAAVVRPRTVRFVPGAYADHLTSMAAAFDAEHQSKCTEWLDAGATASAGTVTEPYAVWMKFPNAWIFVHLAAGCTMLEAVAQSVRCPYQLLPVGDPLAAPWQPRGRVTIESPGDGPVWGRFPVRIRVTGDPEVTWTSGAVFLDGRRRAEFDVAAGGAEVDIEGLDAGVYELRVVVYAAGLVRYQCFGLRELRVGPADGQG